MSDVNTFTHTGRLAADAEIKGNGDNQFVTFRLAVEDYRKDGDNHVNWFDYTYPHTGIANYLTKGRKLTVSGSCRQRQWEQDGEKRYAVGFSVRDLVLGETPQKQGAPPAAGPSGAGEDDIPFAPSAV